MIYEDAICPIGRCGSPLHITWHASRPVFVSDTVKDLQNPADAYTESWEIGCEEGHIILLPLDANDTERFGKSDSDDEIPAEQRDLARLHLLIQNQLS